MIFLFLVSLFIGDIPINVKDFIHALLDNNSPQASRVVRIILGIRAPRALLAASAGGALGVAGALMQSILGNPLASPFTLGVSSAAGFGASLAIVSGISILSGNLAIMGNSFLLAISASLIIYFIAVKTGASPVMLILTGMGVNFLFSSVTTLLHYFSSPEAVYQALFWMTGSISAASWQSAGTVSVICFFAIIAVTPLLYDLSLVLEGEKQASSVGVNVKKVRIISLIIASLLSASAVSITGVIGFIGLVAPHISRLINVSDPRELVPMSAVTGGSLLMLADIISGRILSPVILPIGAVTSLLGVPFFFMLIFSRRRLLWKR